MNADCVRKYWQILGSATPLLQFMDEEQSLLRLEQVEGPLPLAAFGEEVDQCLEQMRLQTARPVYIHFAVCIPIIWPCLV